jgi:hypothetical protein
MAYGLTQAKDTEAKDVPPSREAPAVFFVRVTDSSLRRSGYYSASIDRFVASDPQLVLGVLAAMHAHDLDVEQRQAWEQELAILKPALLGLPGTLYLEFDVPRLGSRIRRSNLSRSRRNRGPGLGRTLQDLRSTRRSIRSHTCTRFLRRHLYVPSWPGPSRSLKLLPPGPALRP